MNKRKYVAETDDPIRNNVNSPKPPNGIKLTKKRMPKETLFEEVI